MPQPPSPPPSPKPQPSPPSPKPTPPLLGEVEVASVVKFHQARSPVAARGLSVLANKEERARNPRTDSTSINQFQLTPRGALQSLYIGHGFEPGSVIEIPHDGGGIF